MGYHGYWSLVVEVKVRHEINGTTGMKDETTVHSDDDDMYVSPIIPILYAARYHL